MASSGPFPLLAHPYQSPTRGSCAYEMGNTAAKNALVFIGGLKDGPHTTPYIRAVARQLERIPELDYSVFEIRMRSSFDGFGTASLADDVHDISALVKYLRSIGRGKVILFGHSTGCQDCMEYTDYAKYSNSPVDGFVLQAPVSDRESLDLFFPDYQSKIEYAERMIAEGKGDDCLPNDQSFAMLGAPVSANRFRDLFAKGGADDYFSSDLDDQTVKKFWGRFDKPVLVLHSEKDEFVPPKVDQAALNKKFQQASPFVSSLSGLIPETGHTVLQEEAQEWLAERVIDFLRTLC
ncbi:hypothetical protein Trco_007730 [Trichoderma cornu-damae]|uniref:Uncharacterized protein n=1 Tax=Trichoderma cornu-damae TaxID=654480 RepID=A0A9P8TUL2_9HYPO|nr:hypothetical protein Trco_007730 [Trichoderma cornu-damae]